MPTARFPSLPFGLAGRAALLGLPPQLRIWLNTRGPPAMAQASGSPGFPGSPSFVPVWRGLTLIWRAKSRFLRLRPSNQRLPAASAGIRCRPEQQLLFHCSFSWFYWRVRASQALSCASPCLLIFLAPLIPRIWRVPHSGQTQVFSPGGRLSSTWPQAPQVLADGK